MKQSVTVDIGRDFSREPAGRYVSDGPTAGEVFREQKLMPALSQAEKVTVVLDGTEGYGSSFLEEAFGGLVRRLAISPDEFARRVVLVSEDDPSLIDEIRGYVEEEARRRGKIKVAR